MVSKKIAPKGSLTIRECGFVEVGVALLEEVCHGEWTKRFQKLIQDVYAFSVCLKGTFQAA